MPELTIAPLARDDLMEIGRYTQETWGVQQRDAYLGALADVFGKIKTGFIASRKRAEIRENLLCYPCNKHIIFFRRDDQSNVEILRILHERMDFARHL